MSKNLKRVLAFVLSLVLICSSIYFGRSWADDIENTFQFTFQDENGKGISNLNVELYKTNPDTQTAERIKVATTNSSGVATFNNLEDAVYLLSPDTTKYSIEEEKNKQHDYSSNYSGAKGFIIFVSGSTVQGKGTGDSFVLTTKTTTLTVNKTTSLVNYSSAFPLSGAKFVLQDANGENVSETLTTDTNGKVVFNNVVPGQYKVVEVEAPKGFVKAEAKDVIVQLDKTNEITFENIAYTTLKIKKIDKETEEKLSGVEFALYLGDELVDTKTTDSNGEITFENIYKHDDAKYHVVETKAPLGYAVAGRITNEYDGSKPVVLTVENTKAKFAISKVKEDGTPLEGAEISVYLSNEKKEELELVYSFTSTSNPEDITEHLEYGNYYLIKETKAPEGYVLNENAILCDWFVEGSENYGKDITVEIKNQKEEPKHEVLIKKVNENGKDLNGAKLAVYRVSSDNTLGEVLNGLEDLTSAPGLKTWLENGKYAVIETQAPEGYVKANPTYFEVKDEDTQVTITDEETSVLIEKKASDTNELLPGATLQIINEEGKVVKTLTSTSTALEVKGLPVGKYTLHETKAPKNYQIANDVEFEISDNAAHNSDTVTMVDQPEDEEIVVKNVLKVSKQDKETKEILHGSLITVYRYYKTPYEEVQYQTVDEEGHYSAGIDIELAEPAEWYIDGDTGTVVKLTSFEIAEDVDICEIPDLENGTYVVVEEEAPVGYYNDSKPVKVVFDKDISQLEKVAFENTSTKVEISKVDSNTKQLIEGAKFELYDGNNLIDSWESTDKPHLIKALEINKEYTLKEVKAPDGYILGKDVTFTVEDLSEAKEKVQTVTFENKKKPNVYTVNVLKIDEQGNPLEGATLALYKRNDLMQNELVKTWTSTKQVEKLENLESGSYILKETKVPDGFVSMPDTEFSITENGQLLSDGKTVVAQNKEFNLNVVNSRTKVLIKKLVEEEKGKTYAVGAILKVTDENEKEVITFTVTEDEPILALSGLLVGKTYKVTEIDAPGRYTIAQPITFTVKDTDKEQSVIMIDHLRDVKYSVSIDKKDTNGAFVKGAKLRLSKLVDEQKETVEEWTTNDNVKTITELEPGEYIVEEITTPVGYRTINPVRFTLNLDQERKTPGVDDFITTKEIHLVDEDTIVKVNKLDSITGKQIAGAEFDIYEYDDFMNTSAAASIGDTSQSDEPVEIDANIKPVYSFTSSTSQEVIKNVLETNKKYVLVESKAPNGYKYINPVDFVVNNNESEIEITVIDDKKEIPSYKVEIIKMDTGKLTLEGATLKLFKIVDGKEVAVEDEWVTTKTGKFFTLQPGEYIVKELKAPDGYLYAGNADYAVKFTIGNGSDTNDSANVVTDTSGKHVTITDDKTEVTIKKVDSEGVRLAGAKLAIMDGDVKVDEWTSSDVSDHVITGKLVAGKEYKLVEVESPTGYEIASPKTFTVPKYNKDFEITLINVKTQIKTYDLTISKQDITTGNEIPGATLKLEKIVEEGTITQDDWTWLSTNEPHSISGLTAGTYRLTELLPPSSQGYIKANDIEFTLNEDGSSSNKVVMHDDYTKVDILKVDDKGNPLEGAVLELIDKDGNVYKTWTSKSTPEQIRRIPVGKYKLVETKAPDTYQIAEPMEIEVLPVGTIQEYRLVNYKNSKTYEVNISKREINGTKELKGASLSVTYKLGTKTNVLDSWTSTEEVHKIKGVVEDVVYTLTEKQAPAGYVKAESICFYVKAEGEKMNIYVGKVGEDKENFTLLENANNTVTMYDDYTKVEVRKVDDKKKLLAGAKLEIKNASGKVVAEFTSTEKEQLIYKLAPGKYTLIETQAPEDYAIAEPVSFEVFETGDVQIVTMTDILKSKTTTYDLTISKQDITNSKELPGAVLIIKDKNGNEVAKWTSTDKPHVIKALPYGEYTLTELSAPSGYVKAETISFTLDKNGKSKDVVTMKDDVTKVEIIKKDANTKNALSGAKLELYNEKNELVESWTTDTNAKKFTKLSHGKYTLKEVQAPEGYKVAKDITFEVTDKAETINITMYDEKETVITPRSENNHTKEELEENQTVQTGDMNNAVPFVAVLVILVMAIPTTVVIYKRKDNDK